MKAEAGPPPEWNEQLYLRLNQDVAEDVAEGVHPSGYAHFLTYGKDETRAGVPSALLRKSKTTAVDTPTTRLCIDPWVYLEVQPTGQLKPCCIQPPYGSIAQSGETRNQESIRALRQSLLDGHLSRLCEKCHIRSTGSTEALHNTVRKLVGPGRSLQDPAPLQEVRIVISEACNLRCVYCAVSQPGYAGQHMSSEVFERALSLLPRDCEGLRIDLNGHGETSFNPDWVKFAKTALAKATGARFRILSNFAKDFDADEIDVLAQMESIGISMDTVDDQLLNALRRKVSFSTIRRNIEGVRARAEEIGNSPAWYLSCGIYDQVVDSMEDLAWFAIEAKFELIDFWNLTPYPDLPNRTAPKVRPLSSLPKEKRQKALLEANRVVDLLRDNGVKVNVAGDFLDEEQLPAAPIGRLASGTARKRSSPPRSAVRAAK